VQTRREAAALGRPATSLSGQAIGHWHYLLIGQSDPRQACGDWDARSAVWLSGDRTQRLWCIRSDKNQRFWDPIAIPSSPSWKQVTSGFVQFGRREMGS